MITALLTQTTLAAILAVIGLLYCVPTLRGDHAPRA